METVLRRLRLKRGDTHESDARKRLQKELFAFSHHSDHGFPSKPSALAYDSQLSLLAIGTETGVVQIYGRPGVGVTVKHKDDVAVMKMEFLPDQGRLITICSDNSLHLWELRADASGSVCLDEVRSHQMDNSKLKMVSSHALSNDGTQLVLGTDGGSVHVFDIATFTLTDRVVFRDIILQNVADELKTSPGSIEGLCVSPADADKLLIAYSRGLLVLWDLIASQPLFTYTASEHLECVSFNSDGSEFITCHADGSYVTWLTNNSKHPKENPNTPYGPFPCKAITSLSWTQGPKGMCMIFAGGMPRASFADRHTVSVMYEGHHVAFDFTARVIDFVVLRRSDEVQSMMVLTDTELIAVDLTSEGWPVLRPPYLMNVEAASAVTHMQRVDDVPQTLRDNITAAGLTQNKQFSTKEWPVLGGEMLADSSSVGHCLLLTGHADGTVKFWDIETPGGTVLLYTLHTADMFNISAVPGEPSANQQDMEWPPFRKVGVGRSSPADNRVAVEKLSFCVKTGCLFVANAGGIVSQFTFESDRGERHIDTSLMDFVSDHEGFVWTGPDALTVKDSVAWTDAGYQPTRVTVMNPPTACTALALHTRGQLMAVSTSHGFGIFDLIRGKTVFATSVAVSSGLKLSRSRSFQKSVRESFRQLRRHKSESEHKPEPKAEVKATEVKDAEATEKEEVGEPSEKPSAEQEKSTEDVVVTETTEKVDKLTIEDAEKSQDDKVTVQSQPDVVDVLPQTPAAEETKREKTGEEDKDVEIVAVEKAVKPDDCESTKPPESADDVPDAAASVTKKKADQQTVITTVECLYFADTFLLQGQLKQATLWVGTRSGHIFIYQLTVPDGENRQEEDVTCFLAKEIRLKHGAPVVTMFVMDQKLHPVCTASPIDAATTTDGAITDVDSGAHRLVVCTKQQIKIFALPTLKAQNKYKLSWCDRDARFVSAIAATFVSKSDASYMETDLVCVTDAGKLVVVSVPQLRRQISTDTAVLACHNGTSGLGAYALSHTGDVFYCSTSELVHLSMSACRRALSFAVPIKEGVRLALVEPVTAAATEAAVDVTEEVVAAKDEADTAAVAPDTVPASGDQAAANETVASGNDSMLAPGDVTVDSVKLHTREDVSEGRNVVSTHKVTETTVHTTKTVGGVVSESSTTTVEELKDVEGIITSCIATSSSQSTSATVTTTPPAQPIEG